MRPGGVHPRCQGAPRLRARRPGGLVGGRLALPLLSAAGGAPDAPVDAERRSTRPHHRRLAGRRRRHAAGGARQPARHADGMDRPVDHRRAAAVRARFRSQPLRSREPEPTAVHARVRGALSRRADRAQPAHHGLGEGRAGGAQGRRAAVRRARVRGARHDGGSRGGSTPPSTRTGASPATATSATRRW